MPKFSKCKLLVGKILWFKTTPGKPSTKVQLTTDSYTIELVDSQLKFNGEYI